MDEIVLDWVAVGFEYPTEESAREVYERATVELHDASMWFVMNTDRTRYLLLGLFQSNEHVDRFDWGEGVLVHVSDEQIEWMTRRRLKRGMAAAYRGEGDVHERTTYEQDDAPRIPE